MLYVALDARSEGQRLSHRASPPLPPPPLCLHLSVLISITCPPRRSCSFSFAVNLSSCHSLAIQFLCRLPRCKKNTKINLQLTDEIVFTRETTAPFPFCSGKCKMTRVTVGVSEATGPSDGGSAGVYRQLNPGLIFFHRFTESKDIVGSSPKKHMVVTGVGGWGGFKCCLMIRQTT